MERIHIRDTDRWVIGEDTAVRGRAFIDGEQRNAAAIAATIDETATMQEFHNAVERLNGFYAIIHTVGKRTYVAVDRARSIALFYGLNGNSGAVYISDDADWVRERIGAVPGEYDPFNEIEFLLAGFVTGPETLYPDIYQLQAGELLVAGPKGVETDRHYRYYPQIDRQTESEAELLERFDDLAHTVFERLIEVADGRQIVVPLSGGYDSRLVVTMLTKLGYENVVAISWGTSWDTDHQVSERIADELGIAWEYVEYTNDRWHEWFHSDERERYYDYSFNYAALPGLVNMTWPAVWELKRSGAIHDDAVFVPGHTAASMSEGVLDSVVTDDEVSEQQVITHLRDRFYRYWDYDSDALDRMLYNRIRDRIEPTGRELRDPVTAAAAYESWDWQEREGKFIHADLHVYDYWGYDWWMPFWDNDYIDFWEGLSLDFRHEKALHKKYAEKLYMNEAGVDISAARETEKSNLVRRVHDSLFHSPLFHLIHPVYVRLRYDRDPRGWPGIMQKEQFTQLFTGKERAYSFFALELLGRVSFDPPENIDVPEGGVLTVESECLSESTGETEATMETR